MKPGIQTTEFWITLIVNAAGWSLATGAIPSDHWAAKVAGAVIAGLAAMGYTAARAKLKAATPTES